MPLLPEETVGLDRVLSVLNRLRVSMVDDEYGLQRAIRDLLQTHAVPHRREYRLGPRNRVDFLVDGGIAIEVKRGRMKPNRTSVIAQLERYAQSEEVSAVILVVDRNLDVPKTLHGKPCLSFGLHKRTIFRGNRLWQSRCVLVLK